MSDLFGNISRSKGKKKGKIKGKTAKDIINNRRQNTKIRLKATKSKSLNTFLSNNDDNDSSSIINNNNNLFDNIIPLDINTIQMPFDIIINNDLNNININGSNKRRALSKPKFNKNKYKNKRNRNKKYNSDLYKRHTTGNRLSEHNIYNLFKYNNGSNNIMSRDDEWIIKYSYLNSEEKQEYNEYNKNKINNISNNGNNSSPKQLNSKAMKLNNKYKYKTVLNKYGMSIPIKNSLSNIVTYSDLINMNQNKGFNSPTKKPKINSNNNINVNKQSLLTQSITNNVCLNEFSFID